MKFAKITGAALGLALATMMMVPVAHASIANQMTKITFSRPVRIPDQQVLPAGAYWFQIRNNTSPNTVAIYNKNRTELLATALTTPAYRAKVRGRTEVTLARGSRNRPPVLLKWFYPGTDYGHEFLYSSKTEHRLHEEVAQNILTKSYSSAG
jgi:hypothetical protein